MAIELFLSLWDSVCSGRMLGTDRDGGAELGVPVLCLLVHRLLPGGRVCVSFPSPGFPGSVSQGSNRRFQSTVEEGVGFQQQTPCVLIGTWDFQS